MALLHSHKQPLSLAPAAQATAEWLSHGWWLQATAPGSAGAATLKPLWVPGTAELPCEHRYFSCPGPVGVLEHTSRGRGLPRGEGRLSSTATCPGREGEMHRAAVAPSELLSLEPRAQPLAPLNNRANESFCQQVCSSPARVGKDACSRDPGGETCFTDLAPSPPSWLRRGRVWGCGGGRAARPPLRDTARRRRRSEAGAASPAGQGAGGHAGQESETPLSRCCVAVWLLACLRSLAPPLIS